MNLKCGLIYVLFWLPFYLKEILKTGYYVTCSLLLFVSVHVFFLHYYCFLTEYIIIFIIIIIIIIIIITINIIIIIIIITCYEDIIVKILHLCLCVCVCYYTTINTYVSDL